LRVDNISKAVSGKCILDVTRPDGESLIIHFADRSTLLVERRGRKLSVALGASADSLPERASGPLPTLRQGEYLDFIKKYISRFGVSPAESDKALHGLGALRPPNGRHARASRIYHQSDGRSAVDSSG